MDHVGVEMDQVEFRDMVPHRRQQGHVGGQIGLQRTRVQPDRLVPHRDQSRPRPGVGAGEQGHLMAEVDQGIGQMRDDTLGAAVKSGRNRLIQRGDLGNFHDRDSRIHDCVGVQESNRSGR